MREETGAPPPSSLPTPAPVAARLVLSRPLVRRRLLAYLRHGTTPAGVREAGCSARSLQRTWEKYRAAVASVIESGG